jgi:subtilisin family serine protease
MQQSSFLLALLGASAVLAACDDVPTGPRAEPELQVTGAECDPANLAPIDSGSSQSFIPGEYIVVFKTRGTALPLTRALARIHGFAPRFRYDYGFAAPLTPQALAAIACHPSVKRIEQDRHGELLSEQPNPPWGLDRIDERFLPLDNWYWYVDDGDGVNVYIVDSGIRATHTDFGNRVVLEYTTIFDGRGAQDCVNGTGHGTRVASVVAGERAGVAKAATIRSIRVADCAGVVTLARLLSALQYIRDNPRHPGVVNLSLRVRPKSDQVDAEVRGLVSRGLPVVVAAGQPDYDQCTADESPQRVAEALVVGMSTNYNDDMSYSSAWGPCLDLFAPGFETLTANAATDTGYAPNTGTSLSAGYTTGVAALYLQWNTPITTGEVHHQIVSLATNRVVDPTPSHGSPAKLLFSRWLFGRIYGPAYAGYCETYYFAELYESGQPPYEIAWYLDGGFGQYGDGFLVCTYSPGVHRLRMQVTDALGMRFVHEMDVWVG